MTEEMKPAIMPPEMVTVTIRQMEVMDLGWVLPIALQVRHRDRACFLDPNEQVVSIHQDGLLEILRIEEGFEVKVPYGLQFWPRGWPAGEDLLVVTRLVIGEES